MMAEGIIEIFLGTVTGYIIGFWMGVRWQIMKTKAERLEEK